jgi:AcrR family transcriptional regulator
VLSILAIALETGDDGAMTTSAAQGARARVRAELTAEIKDEARRQLAEQGAAALSLRAVAREVGLVSSAVYRYFPSRDDLLTALIVDAYDAVGLAAEEADARCDPADLLGRWRAICSAVRGWARAHPNEYALIYGSPVPGYAAPTDTIGPAARPAIVLLRALVDGVAAGAIDVDDRRPIPRAVRADLVALRREAAPGVPEAVLARGLLVWTQLFGAVSFELFGHLNNVIHDYDAFFDHQVSRAGAFLVGGGDDR